MTRLLARRRPYQYHQQGQAMVEYAILLIFLVTLFVGGTELGMSALASTKNTEAAKAGVHEYAEVNQQLLNLLNSEKQYLINLSGYKCSVMHEVTSYGTNPDTTEPYSNSELGADSNDINCTPSQAQMDNGVTVSPPVFDDYVQYMDVMFSTAENLVPGSGIQALEEIAEHHLLSLMGEHLAPSVDCPGATGTPELNWDSNSDCMLSADEISNGFVNNSAGNVDGQDKFKYLLLLSHLQIATLPINTNIPVSQSRILIGNHAAGFSSPSCNGNTYDYGLPNNRYPYNNDADEAVYVKTTGGQLYLFNPMPINLTSCIGTDATRSNKSRISILIDGYGNPGDTNYVPGMPKLNQAMYSNYEKVCIDATNHYVSCTSENVAQMWMKPPGKVCFSNIADAVDSCPGNLNPLLTTGFYFFGNANDSAKGSFEYTQNEPAEFRPTFQLECGEDSKELVEMGDCTNPSRIKIHTRYRSVFEGFLTFGLRSLTQPELLPFFYNPNGVGTEAHVVIGSHGSEVGPLGSNGNPTIKQMQDFRGCYAVDVTSNQVSACH